MDCRDPVVRVNAQGALQLVLATGTSCRARLVLATRTKRASLSNLDKSKPMEFITVATFMEAHSVREDVRLSVAATPRTARVLRNGASRCNRLVRSR